MIDALIPIISGVVSATVQISYAIHQWWQNKKDKRVQNVAFQASQPTSQAAKELQSVMEVQRAFWQSNPGMWQALGRDAASLCLDESRLTCRSGGIFLFELEWIPRSACANRC